VIAVSITAHRDLTEDDIKIIHGSMKALVSKAHIATVFFGGARGGDTEALRAALHFRGEHRRPRFVVVVPDTVANQPVSTQAWTRQADEVVELGYPISKDDGFAAYTARDQYLVDVADTVIAFFNGNYKTGTGKTVKMAEEKGIFVAKVSISGRKVA